MCAKKGPFLQMSCTDMYHFIASFGLFEKSGGESFVIKYWLSSSTMELLWANKNFKYLGLALHLNIAVLEMIMSYDDDSYDKLTCVWDVWFSFALKNIFLPHFKKIWTRDCNFVTLEFKLHHLHNLLMSILGSFRSMLIEVGRDYMYVLFHFILL